MISQKEVTYEAIQANFCRREHVIRAADVGQEQTKKIWKFDWGK